MKIIPTSVLQKLGTNTTIAGRGIHLHVECNSNYYWEGNVGFYDNQKVVEISTTKWSGWLATVLLYGCK